MVHWFSHERTTHIVEDTTKDPGVNHDHNVIKVFAIPTEVDSQSPVQWYDIGNGEAIADFTLSRTTEESDNLATRMVYRIAEDGAVHERFELTLQTGTPAKYKQARDFILAVGLPAPAILVMVDLLSLILIDRIQSYPAAKSAALGKLRALANRGLRFLIDPGDHGLATESRVRPLEARTGHLVGLRPPFWDARLRRISALSSLADPTAVSKLPGPDSPRPYGLCGVRHALPGSLAERN